MGLLDFFRTRNVSTGDEFIDRMNNDTAILDTMEEKRDVEGLITALKDKNLQGRAAIKLGFLGDPRAVDPLIELLISQDLLESMWAASALGKLKVNKAVGPLIKTFLYFEHIYTASDVAASFYLQTGIKDDVSTFNTVASHKNDLAAQNRRYIVEALGNIGDAKGLDIITKALNDRDPGVRNAAEQAYAKFPR